MLITPLELEREPLAIRERLAAAEMEYLPGVRQTGPLAVDGTADLIVEHRGAKELVEDIRLRASYHGPFELECARCLEPVATNLRGEFDLIFRPEDVDVDLGERAISEEETEIGYYGENGLQLEDVVREQVLLSLPSRTLCEDACKGLCPRCGGNRNQSDCQCEEAPADPRWNALAGLAAKLSH